VKLYHPNWESKQALFFMVKFIPLTG